MENWTTEVQTSKWASKSESAHARFNCSYNNRLEQQNFYQNATQANVYGGMNNPAMAKHIA